MTYHLSGVEEDQKDAAERTHEFHARYCPVARSIEAAIDITTELTYV